MKALRFAARDGYPASMRLRPNELDVELASLLEQAGEVVVRSGELMCRLLTDFPEHSSLAREIAKCELEADRITRRMIRRWRAVRDRPRLRARSSLDAGEGLALARSLGDIVDHTEQAAAELGLYHVEAPMEQAVELAEVLARAGEQVAAALRSLAAGDDPQASLLEISRLEHAGDALVRDGLASLFAGGADPIVVIRWKDIFASLEAAIDACKAVANAIEGVLSR